MTGSCSNRIDNILKWITGFSLACFVIWALGACALLKPPPDKTGDQTKEPEVTIEEPASPPCPELSAKEFERQALERLDAGDTDGARERLECALESSPDSIKASDLLEQMDADPREYLGNEYYWYTVKSSETLSRIAKEHLGSSRKFVILARYNDIDVPANLVAGQRIKIPGTEPAPAEKKVPEPPEKPKAPDTASLHDQALQMEQQGKLGEAFDLMTRALAQNPELDNAPDDLARIEKKLILELEETAYNHELSGDTEKAADIWRRILAIDPGNIPAQLALNRLTE